MNNKVYWHNFVTGEKEFIETPTDFSDYVPQVGGLGLYKIYVEHEKMEPIEACLKVLETACGKPPKWWQTLLSQFGLHS